MSLKKERKMGGISHGRLGMPGNTSWSSTQPVMKGVGVQIPQLSLSVGEVALRHMLDTVSYISSVTLSSSW